MKLVTQHVWERYIEKAEDIRHTLGNKEIYQKRKKTEFLLNKINAREKWCLA